MTASPINATPFRLSDLPRLRAPRAPFPHGHRWGPWMLDAQRLCLVRVRDDIDPPREMYEIDLEEISGPFSIVDWIAHLRIKQWGTIEVLGQLVAAFDDIFDPRGRMRPGTDFDAGAILRARVQR